MRIRDVIYGLTPYTVEDRGDRVYLASNESPFDIPKELKEDLFEELKGLEFNRYPLPMADRIRLRLSSLLEIDSENILIGSGSDELLFYITLAVAGCGGSVVSVRPSFSMYRYYAMTTGASFVEVPLGREFSLSADDVIDAAKSVDSSLVFLGYPNNPTGNLWDREEILRIVKELDCVVVVDEAYYDFSEQTLLPYLFEYPNLVVSRTFSKAWALAGLRAGYIVANDRIVDAIKRIKQPFNVNIITQKVVEFSLEHRDYVSMLVKKVVEERNRVQEELSNIDGVVVFPSYTNFIVFSAGGVSARRLYDEGIVVKEFSFSGSVYIRATVGKRKENDALISAVRRLVER